MNRILPLILLITFISTINSFSQKSYKPPVIVCPADYTHTDFHIPPPAKFLQNFKNAKTAAATATTANIVVNYIGFDDAQDAKDAFQFAVDIWSSIIKSDVTIYINATYEPLSSGVLGSAGTGGLYRGFDGAPNDSTWYNVALAEKIAGNDLNEPGEADINASFSSTFNWYLGTDGNTPGGMHDFVTVVLHEIGHGLGFFALNSYDDANGEGRRNPGVFDRYIEDGSGVNIYDVPNNSTELGDFYTSNNLFVNSPLATTSNGGARPKIYAPSNYNGGSSISHWDENTYNGTVDALLTPQIGSGESVHDPGPNMMSFFAEMGWVHTYMKHQPDLIVDNLVDDILVSVQVYSDTTLAVEQPVLHYSFDDFATQTDQNMNDDGGGIYSFTIPNPGSFSILQYYISGVSDVLGRDYTSPSVSSARHKTIIQNLAPVTVPYSLADGGDFESASEFIQLPFKGNTNIWEQGVPTNKLNTPSSGTQVWKTDLDANLLKPNADFSTALISPKFNLSDTTADYNIKFDLSMDVAKDSAIAGLNVMYSVNGGVDWLGLGKANDGRGINWMNKSDEHLLFDNGNGWVLNNTEEAPQEVSYNLSEIIGNGESEVYFALVASVTNAYFDELYVFDGIMIDDFEITKTEPRAFFYVAGSSVNLPNDTIQFNYISKGAETFSWDFGDGEFSNKKNPIHAYQAGGIYDVSLSVTYPGGNHTHTKDSAISVVAFKEATYTLADGGDMESNFSDFLVENISGTPLERGNSSIAGKNGTASGNFAWVTGIDEEEYKNRSIAYLYTPMFDFSLLGNYELSFKANYQFEDGWDGFILEYSLDFGENWQQLNPVVEAGWYDKIGEDNPEQGWPAIPLFTGTTNGNFDTKSVDVSNFGGTDRVAFRFYFKTDYASVEVGMALDDFTLTGPSGPAIPNFTMAGNTGCEGQIITFANTSTGSISSMNWDFGANATPATGIGVGPFEVTYSGSGTSTVTLTVESSENGTQIESKIDAISIAPLHTPSYTTEAVSGNDAQLNLVATDGDVFQWFIDNDSIEGAMEQIYLAIESGNYSVSVSIDGCIVNTGNTNIITAINNDSFAKSISVYPNPTSENIYVDVSNDYKGIMNLKVYNVYGKQFYSSVEYKERVAFTKEIPAFNFNAGIYFVELHFGDKREVRKIVIE